VKDLERLIEQSRRFLASPRVMRKTQRNQPLPRYEVDEDTKELLQEVLGLAQRIVDLQYDEEMGDVLQDMLLDLSERFDIQSSEVKVTVDEDGTITAKIVADEATQPLPNSREGIKLVSDNSDKIVEFAPRSKGELPPGFHLTPDEPRSGPAPDSDND
jgi:hypothetical protein